MKPVGEARMSLRLPPELKAMTEAVATFEDRRASDIVRIALKHYFVDQGYFEHDFITQLNKKDRTP
jgi:predicted transcriptional regulator